MLDNIVVLCFFISNVLMMLWICLSVLVMDKKVKSRLDYYLDTEKDSKNTVKVEKESVIKKLLDMIKKSLPSLHSKDLDIKLKRAGMEISQEDYNMIKIITILGSGCMLYLINNSVFSLLIGCLLGYSLLAYWLNKKIAKRIDKFDSGLPDMLTTIIGALRTGYSFNQSLKIVVDECESPIKEEIGLLLNDLNYGVNIDTAFDNLLQRVPSEAFKVVSYAVLIHNNVGGNLTNVLKASVDTIRGKVKLQGKVKTLTAQGKLSGYVVGGLPVFVGVIMYLSNPEYISLLFTTSIGRILVCVGIISDIIGFVVINKITKIKI